MSVAQAAWVYDWVSFLSGSAIGFRRLRHVGVPVISMNTGPY